MNEISSHLILGEVSARFPDHNLCVDSRSSYKPPLVRQQLIMPVAESSLRQLDSHRYLQASLYTAQGDCPRSNLPSQPRTGR